MKLQACNHEKPRDKQKSQSNMTDPNLPLQVMGQYRVVRCLMDGACLYRALSMALAWLGGRALQEWPCQKHSGSKGWQVSSLKPQAKPENNKPGRIWQDLRDDSEAAQVLRSRIMTHMQLHLRGLSVEDRIVMADALSTEMEDDPSFEQQGSWSWPVYFQYAARARTFGTFSNVQVHGLYGVGLSA